MSPVALALAPMTASASVTTTPVVHFANDPVSRAALVHLRGAVQRLVENFEMFEAVNGPDPDALLSNFSKYKEWDTVDTSDDAAVEDALIECLNQAAAEIRAMCDGTHPGAAGKQYRRAYATEMLGFDWIPYIPSRDGTLETLEALKVLIYPKL